MKKILKEFYKAKNAKKIRTIFFVFFFFTFSFYCHSQTNNNYEIKILDDVKVVCNKNNGTWNDQKKLACNLVLTIGVDDNNSEAHLEAPYIPFVDKDNNIYVHEYTTKKIKVYNNLGKLKQVITLSPNRNSFGTVVLDSSKNIYSIDGYLKQLYVYSSEGLLVQSLSIPKYLDKLFLNYKTQELFYLRSSVKKLSFSKGEVGLILPFTLKDFFGQGFGVPSFHPSIDYWSSSAVQVGCLNDGRIILAITFPFEIKIYTSQGDLQTIIKREGAVFTETYNFRGDLIVTRRRFGFLLCLKDGKFMLAFLDRGENWIENAKKGDLNSQLNSRSAFIYDLYDSSGIFLQEFKSPNNLSSILRYSDYQGFMYEKSWPKYGMSAGKYVINKYEIEFLNK